MSITTKMKVDRASALLNSAVGELKLAAEELLAIKADDPAAEAAHDIGAAVEMTVGSVRTCARSAFELNGEVQKR